MLHYRHKQLQRDLHQYMLLWEIQVHYLAERIFRHLEDWLHKTG